VPPTGEAVAAAEDDEEEDGGRQGHGHDGHDGGGSHGGDLGGPEETVTKKQQLRHSLFDPCRLAHSSSLLLGSAATVVVEGGRPEEGARRPKEVVEVEGGRPQTVSTQGPATCDQKDMFTLLSQ
jgi:hypothetical protein